MARSREELKAKLMAKAEVVIDELLARRKDPREASLSDIEQAVLVAGQRLEQALTEELVRERGASGRGVADLSGMWGADESQRQAA